MAGLTSLQIYIAPKPAIEIEAKYITSILKETKNLPLNLLTDDKSKI